METLAINKTIKLAINDATQQIRMCAERFGLPPILIVQAGPGFPLLHEVTKFQRRLNLEKNFTVCYWDQRGCGIALRHDATNVSLPQQVDDLRAILQWLNNETKQTIIVFGISLGATIALQAATNEPDIVKTIIAISPDANIARSDAAAASFLKEQSAIASNGRLGAKLMKLGELPYINSATFQLRASILADLCGIEHGKRFGALLRETLFSLISTYGLLGTVRALRNMNRVQNILLPQLVSLNLFSNPPRLAVPVHYIFGEQDPLIPPDIAKELPVAISTPQATIRLVSHAGHMVHFDQPDVVREIVLKANDGK